MTAQIHRWASPLSYYDLTANESRRTKRRRANPDIEADLRYFHGKSQITKSQKAQIDREPFASIKTHTELVDSMIRNAS